MNRRALGTVNELGFETADCRKKLDTPGSGIPVVLLILTVRFCMKGVFVRVDVLPD